MRKCLVLLLAVVLAGGLIACGEQPLPPDVSTSEQMAPEAIFPSTQPESETILSQAPLIEVADIYNYIPEPMSVRMNVSEYTESRAYRRVYYVFPSEYVHLDSDGDIWLWNYEDTIDSPEPPEMILVTFIKYFNIPKEKFEQATADFINYCIEANRDMSWEPYEPPNPDIIYTFDNEIINEYYRRR